MQDIKKLSNRELHQAVVFLFEEIQAGTYANKIELSGDLDPLIEEAFRRFKETA